MRRNRLEKKGWKVSLVMNSNNYIARKGNRTEVASSVTQLHKIIFGY
jgi:hypothetical protein